MTLAKLQNIYDATMKIPAADLLPPVVHRVGQLTAEAMKTEFDSAAGSIETLGHELLAIKARLDKEQAAIMDAIDQVNALAKEWRERGQRMAATVEDCAAQTQRVRDVCRDLTPKSE